MIRILNIKHDGDEMENAINEAMEIINLYPSIFPHLAGQGFKLKKYFSKPNGGVVLQDGVVITFEKSKSNSKIARKTFARKKKGDMIIHQIASNRRDGSAQRVLSEFIKYCKSLHCENIILSVRTSNETARKFYQKNGFELVDENSQMWHGKKEGYISGSIYKLRLPADKNIETIVDYKKYNFIKNVFRLLRQI
jgi:GNAT superfamily N-acetyltransferase